MGKSQPSRAHFPVGPVSPEDFSRLQTLGVITRLEGQFEQAVTGYSPSLRLYDGIERSPQPGVIHRTPLRH